MSLSATVSNAEEFGDWLGEVRGDVDVVVSEHRPVPLWQHMMVGQTHVRPVRRRTVDAPTVLPRDPRPRAAAGDPDVEQRGAGRSRGPVGGTTRRARHRGAGGPRRRGEAARRPAGAGGPGAADVPVAARPVPRSSSGSTATACCRPSPSSSAGSAATAPSASCCATGVRLIPERRGRRASGAPSRSASGAWPTRTSACSATGTSSTGSPAASPRTTPGCCRPSARSSRSCSPRGGSGPSSPPRRWRSASTCRRAPSCSRSSSSSTARRTPTSRRRSTPSSPAAPGVAASTSRATPSCCGAAASTRSPSPGSPRRAPTRCARASGRPTTWRSTSCAQVGRETRPRDPRDLVRPVPGRPRRRRDRPRGAAQRGGAGGLRRGDALPPRRLPRVRRAAPRDRATLEKEGAKARSASRRAEAAVSLGGAADRRRHPDPAGRRAGCAVVVQADPRRQGEPAAPTVVTEDKQLRRLTLVDVPDPVEPITHVKVPPHFNAKRPRPAATSPTSLRIAVPHDPPPRRRAAPTSPAARTSGSPSCAAELKAHPCHQCPDREDHARWAERWWRLKRETVGLQRKVEGRTNSVARTFDRICDAARRAGLPRRRRHRRSPSAGERLRRLYTEKDLLAAECLRHGVWKRLDAAGLAAVVLGAGPRAAPRRGRGLAADAERRRRRGAAPG